MTATAWRPPPRVRAIAIAVIRRPNDDLLLMRVRDDAGTTKGWRPLGGAIELGERAADTVARELREELAIDVVSTRFLGVLENIYEHEGAPGHELVMVHEAALPSEAYARERFDFVDGGVAVETAWVPLEDFRAARQALYPTGLLDLLTANAEPR